MASHIKVERNDAYEFHELLNVLNFPKRWVEDILNSYLFDVYKNDIERDGILFLRSIDEKRQYSIQCTYTDYDCYYTVLTFGCGKDQDILSSDEPYIDDEGEEYFAECFFLKKDIIKFISKNPVVFQNIDREKYSIECRCIELEQEIERLHRQIDELNVENRRDSTGEQHINDETLAGILYYEKGLCLADITRIIFKLSKKTNVDTERKAVEKRLRQYATEHGLEYPKSNDS